MKYIYTKLVWRNNKYVLQVKQHKTDPFKQVFSSKIKQEVKARRKALTAKPVKKKVVKKKGKKIQ